jgi:hypothetical protein
VAEAQALVVLYSAYNSVRRVHQIRQEWADDDIAGAVAHCRRKFRLDTVTVEDAV